MEIKLPKTPFSSSLLLEKIQSGVFGGATPSVEAVLPQQTLQDQADAFDHKTLSELLEHTVDLLSIFDRELKYEILEEAGVVQIQVIDSRDGKVVRKVPADEVIKFLAALKEQIDDRVDIFA
ncbi:MAG: flagellar protein FlaG [Synergistaceae bacterium]|jgi:uncharacterized FlaG/YvyC family protein|nr:flagellar protein FlaG [Synergistaceae bacterium]